MSQLNQIQKKALKWAQTKNQSSRTANCLLSRKKRQRSRREQKVSLDYVLTLLCSAYFSSTNLSDLPVSEQTLKGIKELGFTKATEIQARSIPHILNGRDVLGQAKTGSGKTLAYMVPAVELLRRANFTPKNGTGVLIMTPTRELAMHNYKWARDLL